MTSRKILVAIAIIGATSLGGWVVMASDDNREQGPRPTSGVERSSDLVIDQAILVPASFALNEPAAQRSAVVTLFVHNEGDAVLTATEVAVDADNGLSAEYVGYTTCSTECVGSGEWKTSRRVVMRSLEGRLPIEFVPPSSSSAPKGLILRLTPARDLSPRALSTGCLRLRAIVVTLDSGATSSITLPSGGPVAGIRRVSPRPPSRGCHL